MSLIPINHFPETTVLPVTLIAVINVLPVNNNYCKITVIIYIT